MFRKTGFLFAALIMASSVKLSSPQTVSAGAETVQVWLTKPDQSQLLAQQPSLSFAAQADSTPLTITVDDKIKYQQMDGWGASITDSSAWLMWNKLSVAMRNALMMDLFDKKSGIGFSFLRQPMGASDFSTTSAYSYDDGAADPTLSNFSISHDTEYIIPLLHQALTINPSIKIVASPWSPPGWMKSGGSMIGGTLLSQYEGSLAAYFVKYLQAYQEQSIPIYALTLQNEPFYNAPDYPGMKWAAIDERDFIKNHLGPALAAADLHPKLMVYDHNWDRPDYPTTIFADPVAASYVAGVAWHCYGGDVEAQRQVHDQYPTKETWETECSSGSWSPVFARNLHQQTESLVILNARYWGKSGVTWNIALDANGHPSRGGCQGCRGVVTIDPAAGTYTKEVEYYSLGHASKFVDSGAYRIDSNTFGDASIEDVAFQNPDGSVVIVALNSAMSERTFTIAWHGQSFAYTLPAYAVVTFKWSSTGNSDK